MKMIARITLLLMLIIVAAACSDDGGDEGDSAEAITQPDSAAVVDEAPADDGAAEVAAPVEEVASEEPVVEAPMEEAPMEEAPVVEEEAPAPAEPVVERPSWQTVELVDANTGQTFTLADFAGKTVFVEPMATWCTNCRSQLGRVGQARAQLNGDDFVFIALSLELGLSNDALAIYTQREGFDWTFAVMPEAFLGMLRDEFGRGVSTAPGTPHFVIRPDGTFTDLRTGRKSVEEIVAEMTENSEV